MTKLTEEQITMTVDQLRAALVDANNAIRTLRGDGLYAEILPPTPQEPLGVLVKRVQQLFPQPSVS